MSICLDKWGRNVVIDHSYGTTQFLNGHLNFGDDYVKKRKDIVCRYVNPGCFFVLNVSLAHRKKRNISQNRYRHLHYHRRIFFPGAKLGRTSLRGATLIQRACLHHLALSKSSLSQTNFPSWSKAKTHFPSWKNVDSAGVFPPRLGFI